MKTTSRLCAAVVCTLAMVAAGDASADTSAAVLNSYSKVWVNGDIKGPEKLEKNTGAGTMDAAFTWDRTGYATDKAKVNLGTVFTRSSAKPNNNNSYMQGGVAFATLTEKGVVPGAEIELPILNGERAFMRPLIGFLPGERAIVMAASEDNGVNNNPQPVAFIVSTKGGAPLKIPNNTRGKDNTAKPTNIIRTAVDQNGVNVQNPNDQRGPHTITQVNDNTFIVGMQYNNQAQEAYSISVAADNTVKVNWLVRYSNTAQHCRPSVAYEPGANSFYIAAVEADNQPAEIGFRVTQANVADGKSIVSKIVVRSDPKNNKYVSEPVLDILGDKLAVSYGMSAKARNKGQGDKGHAGGQSIHNAVLLGKTDLSVIGAPMLAVGQYGRHGSSFVTTYGPNAEPALAVIGGSSTGTGGGFIQMYPLKADGTLGVKDAAKVYQVSTFSDVANVQARGKRNPQDQARGFINGLGSVPNPGFTADAAKAATNFMPEVKAFSFSTVTGYSGAEAMGKGLKNSIWLSLVPAAWQTGLATVPGKPTDKPGVNEDGTGPAPRTTATPTNPNGEGGEGSVIGGDETAPGKTRAFDSDSGGCSISHGSSSTSNVGLAGLAALAAVFVIRRKRQEA